jgi:membrane-bound lytic murein transglycosylase A
MLSLVRPLVGRLDLLSLTLSMAGLLGLAGCAAPTPSVVPIAPEAELDLRPVSFDSLEGWSEDDPSEALIAFRRSCTKLRSSGSGPMGPEPVFGAVADWLAACAAADEHARAPSATSAAESVRRFFETWFQPYQVLDDDEPEGLFTGYYEPVLQGSRRAGPLYPVPLHAPPADLLRIDLGRFNPDLAGYAIYGRIGRGEFLPYYSRAEIERGVLAGQNLELLWVDDPIAKFFLQIQGSGRVRLDDGSVVRVGYASQNGHPYRAIGRDLIEIGALSRDEVSLQTIRAWLQAHPDDAAVIMARNRSYIFFHEHPQLAAEDGPLGAQGVPLTAGRSLAVDRRYIPLGVPLWVETTAPGPEGALPLRRLMIAQDTGGAIKGVVRGDVFWGAGERAEAVAGRMKSPGRYAVLLPRALVPTS